MSLFKPAERKQLKLRMALEGPSGSGKTYSALLIASGLVGSEGKIAVLDTENRSASLYSEDFSFDTADLQPPYTPENYVKYIRDAESNDFDCLIIDSMSHAWEGTGGVLDIHNSIGGNSYVAWNQAGKRHNILLEAIIRSPCHVIVTLRSKQGYALELQDNKQVPVKIGMKPIQRDGIEYEFDVTLKFDLKEMV